LLNPLTQAGQFGNACRNIARGPAFTNLDLSLTRDFNLTENTRLQFRAESFNIANYANFGLPVADMNSANSGASLQRLPPACYSSGLNWCFKEHAHNGLASGG